MELMDRIKVAGQAQELFPTSAKRKALAVQNNSQQPLTIGLETEPTKDGPLVVRPGELFSLTRNTGLPLGGTVRIWGSIEGQQFSAWWY